MPLTATNGPPSSCVGRITVAKHNTRESCWVILYGTAYDVTGRCSHTNSILKLIIFNSNNPTPRFHRIPPRWGKRNPQTRWARCNRGVRSYPPSGASRRNPIKISNFRSCRPFNNTQTTTSPTFHFCSNLPNNHLINIPTTKPYIE